jgi:broad specificity phosphatase PhoE
MEREIFWVRHGESVANTFNYFHSLIIDPELTNLGKKQMLEVAKKIVNNNIEIMVCSPLKRSIQSCQIIQNYIETITEKPITIYITNSIKESGLGLDNIALHKTDSFINKLMNFSPFSFYSTFYELLKSLMKYDKKIAIIGHQHVNTKFIRLLSNIQIEPMKNGEIIKMNIKNTQYILENYLKK